MGRRKIEIEPLTDDRNRTVTFVKRKAGLFKKAYELAVLCQVDIAVIIVGNNDKVYEFLLVDTNELLKAYQRVEPHELKLPEYYGPFKKKLHLQARFQSDNLDIPDVQDDAHGDSDYELDTPEPKRRKRASAASIYLKKAPPARYPAMPQDDQQTHRPVLRVQIPSDVKLGDDSAKTITALEAMDARKDKLAPVAMESQAPALAINNATRYAFNKFKSPETKKAPQLPLPISKLQTLSPLLTTAPPLPSSMPYFLLLPQPLPLGQYPPAILPTPVFNQVFNQWQGQTPVSGVNIAGAGATAPANNGMTQGVAVQNTGNTGNNGTENTGVSGTNTSGAVTTGVDDEAPKFRPPLQFNGEQTPMSALPSRYMNDFFPSPSNFYPGQEWPTGMTPYQSGMPHYFVMSSANGATPLPMNAAYTNVRPSLQQLGPSRQFQPPGLQPQGPDYGQYYKR